VSLVVPVGYQFVGSMTDKPSNSDTQTEFRLLRGRTIELKSVDSAHPARVRKSKPRAKSVHSHSRSPLATNVPSDTSGSESGFDIADARKFIATFKSGCPSVSGHAGVTKELVPVVNPVVSAASFDIAPIVSSHSVLTVDAGSLPLSLLRQSGSVNTVHNSNAVTYTTDSCSCALPSSQLTSKNISYLSIAADSVNSESPLSSHSGEKVDNDDSHKVGHTPSSTDH